VIALPHRRQAEPPAPKPVCGSDAMFMVRAGADDTDVCAAHFPKLLTAVIASGKSPVYWEVDPGRRCHYRPGVDR